MCSKLDCRLTCLSPVTCKAVEIGAMTAPHPLDLSHHLSYATKNKKPSSVKDFYKYFQIPGIANFAGGKIEKTARVRIVIDLYQDCHIHPISLTIPSKPKSHYHSAWNPTRSPLLE